MCCFLKHPNIVYWLAETCGVDVQQGNNVSGSAADVFKSLCLSITF